MRRIRVGRRALAAALTAFVPAAGSWTAATASAEEPPGPEPTAQARYGGTGPHPVATNAQVGPCQASIVGFVQNVAVHIFGNTDDLTCTAAFPNGLDSPAGVNTYFPADIAELPSAPLIVLTGGIDANPGMYDRLARQWASQGFVVTIPYEWFNSLAYVPAAGLALGICWNAPAWIANARGVRHFSPVDGTDAYRSSGTAVAWLRYLGFGDPDAARYFVGPDWLLRQDKTYFSVERHPLADSVR
ncbi:hypothetical protein ACQP06_06750 [Nocardia sp. CA-136227]|uniref:hypothetical protein n=1 Tax=Nocardia sp. CA-136227 TaxID=3239979 RepID=UPI003D966608